MVLFHRKINYQITQYISVVIQHIDLLNNFVFLWNITLAFYLIIFFLFDTVRQTTKLEAKSLLFKETYFIFIANAKLILILHASTK